MLESGNAHGHLWKKLADQMCDNWDSQVNAGDTVDLAYKLEWLRIGQNANLGTEPLKINKKEKVY